MAYTPLTKLPQQFFDNLGDPLVGGTIEAYLAGTTTPTNMFSDDAGTVAGTSVTLDSRGEPTTFKQIWLDETKTYKFILKDSSGSTIWTVDDVPADPSNGVAGDITIVDAGGYYAGTTVEAALQEAASYAQEGAGAVVRAIDSRLKEAASALDYGLTGDGVADDSSSFSLANTAISTRSKTLFIPGGKTIKLDSNVSFSAGNVAVVGPATKFTRDTGVTLANRGLMISLGGFDSQLSGTSSQITRGMYLTINGAVGASTSLEPIVVYHGVNISGDELEVEANSSSKTAVGFRVTMAAGGTSMTGARDALSGLFTLTSASASGSTVRSYKAVSGVARANVNDNGTSGTKAGKLYGVQGSVYLDSSATHFDVIASLKATTRVASATDPGSRYGLLVINDGDLIADRGSAHDAMIGLTDATSSATGTWSTGILFGDMGGQHPVQTVGALIKTVGSSSVETLMDFSSYTVTNKILHATGLHIYQDDAGGIDYTRMILGNSDRRGRIDLRASANTWDARIDVLAGTGGDGTGEMQLKGDKVNFLSKISGSTTLIPDFADDAAAAIGGVEVGEFYRTGSTLKMRVS